MEKKMEDEMETGLSYYIGDVMSSRGLLNRRTQLEKERALAPGSF